MRSVRPGVFGAATFAAVGLVAVASPAGAASTAAALPHRVGPLSVVALLQ